MSVVKIIHTGDWHFGKLLHGYSLIDDQRQWLSTFVQAMQTEKPDVVLIAGDVFDRGVPPAAAMTLLGDALHTLTHTLGITVMMIAGNHDAGERLAFARELLSFSGVHIAGCLQSEIHKVTLQDQYGFVHFYLLPHSDRHLLRKFCTATSTDSFNDLFYAFCRPMLDTLDTTARNVLMAHGFFAAKNHDLEYNGVSVGGSEKVDLTPFSAFDYIALGHLHSAKNTGLKQAQYAGSPLKYSIAEATQKKSCFIISLEKKGVSTQSLLHIPHKRDLHMLTGTFSDLLVQGQQLPEPLEDYVFLTLLDTIPVTDAVMRLKPYYPYILGISFEKIAEMMPTTTSLPSLQLQSPQALFASFYSQSTGSPLTNFQQKVLSTGYVVALTPSASN